MTQPKAPTAAVKHQALKIVRTHAAVAAGIGIIPIPVVDFVGITAVQFSMLRKLVAHYHGHGVEFTTDLGKHIIGTFAGVYGGMRVAGGLAKLFPPFTLISRVAAPSAAGVSTYALGYVFVQHYDNGGTFVDFAAHAEQAFARVTGRASEPQAAGVTPGAHREGDERRQ